MLGHAMNTHTQILTSLSDNTFITTCPWFRLGFQMRCEVIARVYWIIPSTQDLDYKISQKGIFDLCKMLKNLLKFIPKPAQISAISPRYIWGLGCSIRPWFIALLLSRRRTPFIAALNSLNEYLLALCQIIADPYFEQLPLAKCQTAFCGAVYCITWCGIEKSRDMFFGKTQLHSLTTHVHRYKVQFDHAGMTWLHNVYQVSSMQHR